MTVLNGTKNKQVREGKMSDAATPAEHWTSGPKAQEVKVFTRSMYYLVILVVVILFGVIIGGAVILQQMHDDPRFQRQFTQH